MPPKPRRLSPSPENDQAHKGSEYRSGGVHEHRESRSYGDKGVKEEEVADHEADETGGSEPRRGGNRGISGEKASADDEAIDSEKKAAQGQVRRKRLRTRAPILFARVLKDDGGSSPGQGGCEGSEGSDIERHWFS